MWTCCFFFSKQYFFSLSNNQSLFTPDSIALVGWTKAKVSIIMKDIVQALFSSTGLLLNWKSLEIWGDFSCPPYTSLENGAPFLHVMWQKYYYYRDCLWKRHRRLKEDLLLNWNHGQRELSYLFSGDLSSDFGRPDANALQLAKLGLCSWFCSSAHAGWVTGSCFSLTVFDLCHLWGSSLPEEVTDKSNLWTNHSMYVTSITNLVNVTLTHP